MVMLFTPSLTLLSKKKNHNRKRCRNWLDSLFFSETDNESQNFRTATRFFHESQQQKESLTKA
jgi:hypothetical protein